MDVNQALRALSHGKAVYAEYFEREQVKRRVFAITKHAGGEVTLEHGPSDTVRLGLNRVVFTRS